MSSKPFTIDPSRESLYEYAPTLVTQAIRERLRGPQFEKTMQQISSLESRNQVMSSLFVQVMANIVWKFEHDAKVVADCKKEMRIPEDLQHHYKSRVMEAVSRAFREWEAKHPERHFVQSPSKKFKDSFCYFL